MNGGEGGADDREVGGAGGQLKATAEKWSKKGQGSMAVAVKEELGAVEIMDTAGVSVSQEKERMLWKLPL